MVVHDTDNFMQVSSHPPRLAGSGATLRMRYLESVSGHYISFPGLHEHGLIKREHLVLVSFRLPPRVSGIFNSSHCL